MITIGASLRYTTCSIVETANLNVSSPVHGLAKSRLLQCAGEFHSHSQHPDNVLETYVHQRTLVQAKVFVFFTGGENFGSECLQMPAKASVSLTMTSRCHRWSIS